MKSRWFLSKSVEFSSAFEPSAGGKCAQETTKLNILLTQSAQCLFFIYVFSTGKKWKKFHSKMSEIFFFVICFWRFYVPKCCHFLLIIFLVKQKNLVWTEKDFFLHQKISFVVSVSWFWLNFEYFISFKFAFLF